jgi:hypothetical protein
LATITSSAKAPESDRLPSASSPLKPDQKAWIGDVAPTRVRRFYFSEKLDDPNDPTSAVEFYLTEEGHTPKMFDMNAKEPGRNGGTRVSGRLGSLRIRSSELHDFHIHQLHFLGS